jgi:hypothetical protein
MLNAEAINERAAAIVRDREVRSSQAGRPLTGAIKLPKDILQACRLFHAWVIKNDIPFEHRYGWLVASYEICGDRGQPEGTCGDCDSHITNRLYVCPREGPVYTLDASGFAISDIERRIAHYVADTGIPFE